MRYEWWGFLAAGDCPAALTLINYQAMPDRFSLVFCTKKNPFAVLTICKRILRILGIWRKWDIYPISLKSPISPISETAISATLGINSNEFDFCPRLHDISYKNQRFLVSIWSMLALLKCGIIWAIIEGYFIVTGKFCCLTDFQ
jgi:hypothetical protein